MKLIHFEEERVKKGMTSKSDLFSSLWLTPNFLLGPFFGGFTSNGIVIDCSQ
jgi:hypothetical protein